MTDEEVNQIIGEFMGDKKVPRVNIMEDGRVESNLEHIDYTGSLDRLIPVLEKITKSIQKERYYNNATDIDYLAIDLDMSSVYFGSVSTYEPDRIKHDFNKKDLRRSAAYSIASVIKELND